MFGDALCLDKKNELLLEIQGIHLVHDLQEVHLYQEVLVVQFHPEIQVDQVILGIL